MTLGPRVLKTGIAITLALYVCELLGWGPALFAAVAAIFTLQPSIYKSWRQVLDQLQTNTLGAGIALVANHLFGNEPIAIGLIAILVILICLKMRMEDTIGLTLVTVLAVMSAPGDEDLWFALNRFLLILIGMASAFVVNITILRPKHDKLFLAKVKSVFEQFSILLRTVISGELTEKAFKDRLDKVTAQLEQLDEIFHMFDEERRKLGKLRKFDARQFVVFRQMQQVLHKGMDVLQIVEEHYAQHSYSEEIHAAFDRHLEMLIRKHEQTLLGYQGEMKEGVFSGDETVRENGVFLKNVMAFYEEAPNDRLGVVLTGSAIFEYGYQVHRLERLIEIKPSKDQ